MNDLSLSILTDCLMKEPILFNDTILQNALNGLHGNQAGFLSDKEKRSSVIEA
jgi:hypothetical protein